MNNNSNKSNIFKLFKNKKLEKNFGNENKMNDKEEIKTNDKISIKSASSDKIKEIKENNKENTNNNNINHNYKFSKLDTSQSTSFTINSIYENINQISKYKYHQNFSLREKIKQTILDEIDKESQENKEDKENNENKNNIKIPLKSSKTIKKKTNFLDIKKNININKNTIIRKK